MVPDDILDVLAARQALASTPEPWLDAARGAIAVEEAAERVGEREDPELVERSKRLFAAGDDAVDEARLRTLLDQGFARPRRAWTGPLVVVLALAAVVVLALTLRPDRSVATREVPQLARYELELGHVARAQRGHEPAPGDVARFYADRELQATLRPTTAVTTEIQAAAYACEGDAADAPARLLAPAPRIQPGGLVVLESGVAELGLGVGRWTLLFVVGPAGSLPEPRRCADASLDARDDVRALRTRIEIVPPPR